MGLEKWPRWHFNARIYQEKNAGIQAYHAQTITNVSVLTWTKEIWVGRKCHPPLGGNTQIRCKGHQTRAKYCREHLVLRMSSQHDGSYGPQVHRHGANKSNWKSIGKMHTIIGLPGGTPGRKSPIPRIRHDNEYPFRHVVPLQGKDAQQNMRTFFPGVGAKKMASPFG